MVNESIKLEFLGRERVLRFGIGPSRILCEDKGITVTDMNTLDINELIQDLIYASLKFECYVNGHTVDFNKWEVYQWITDMEQVTFQQIFEVFIKTRTVGKSIYDVYMKNLEAANQPRMDTPEEEEKKNKPGMT